jgi:three-Cys-motif partner protein
MARRGWGYWTEAKLDILSAYLPAFTTASKSVGSTTYLDLFAGHAENERRDTGVDVKGSAIRALEVVPPLTDLYFCDLPQVAAKLETALRAQFPGREFTVVAGDSNVTIDSTLREIERSGKAWQPTFAFIDPYNIGSLHWSTFEKLAAFKSPPRSKYKVELWILFMGSAIQRQLGLETIEQEQMVSRLFGSEEWRPIAESLSGQEAFDEYTNLMRWRLENVLGYASTHFLRLNNVSGSTYIYDLIFATDNAAGDRIMASVYNSALPSNERMRLEAYELRRAHRSSQSSLFDAATLATGADMSDLRYVHVPPEPPLGHNDRPAPV